MAYHVSVLLPYNRNRWLPTLGKGLRYRTRAGTGTRRGALARARAHALARGYYAAALTAPPPGPARVRYYRGRY